MVRNLQLVKDYVFRDIRPDLNRPGKERNGTGARQPDLPKRLLVEASAIACVHDFYSSHGYVVDSVEADNVGWDLNATDEEGILKLDVNGPSGSAIATELTPNEYEQGPPLPQPRKNSALPPVLSEGAVEKLRQSEGPTASHKRKSHPDHPSGLAIF